MKDSYFIHAILHIYHTDNHHVTYERYSEALSFICILLYFSELKDMHKTLSFIYNYTENVFVTYKMKHFGHFSENNMYICVVWMKKLPINEKKLPIGEKKYPLMRKIFSRTTR